ncbi:Tn3 family transposase [Streptomyces herbicida]|uniref:Tn3 family transposase n=1 Tax=Streptomyces herbicida TaxID=3065675 RepID=UPI00292DF1F7|nr:Tn3 family transposase [Streptomyces sp. NEAU-HV9]
MINLSGTLCTATTHTLGTRPRWATPSPKYERIFKTLHVLTYVDVEPYRRDIQAMRALQEGRHDLARHMFHGGKGELRQPYHAGYGCGGRFRSQAASGCLA